MKNILGTTEDLEFYNKEGKLVYEFKTTLCGVVYELHYGRWIWALCVRDCCGEYEEFCGNKEFTGLPYGKSKALRLALNISHSDIDSKGYVKNRNKLL